MLFNNLYHVIEDDILEESLTDKCIVLDLDQTLIATQDDLKQLFDSGILKHPHLVDVKSRTYMIEVEDLEKPGIGTQYKYWGVVRPYTHDFLVFCFSYFKIVAVWSAGKRKYVEGIVDYLFRNIRQPHLIFTFDDTIMGRSGVEKPLAKMIEYSDMTRKYMTLANTYALDDNPNTFIRNPGNALFIPEYNPEPNINGYTNLKDNALLKLKLWLERPNVMNASDIRLLDKTKIFL